VPPWRRPWTGGNTFLPLRHSGNAYRGINTLILWIESDAKGYASLCWMTFKQAQEYGGSVTKGEKSTAILWCEPINRGFSVTQ
jgi:antirestriction protein ArdC